jgi:hypothetical protein
MSTETGNLVVDVAVRTAAAAVAKWDEPAWDGGNVARLVAAVQDAVLEFADEHDLDLDEVSSPSVVEAIKAALA